MNTSFSGMPTLSNYSADYHLLVPNISVTPEVQTSNQTISTVWAAVEISVKLSQPFINGTPSPHTDGEYLLSNPLRAGSVSRFGNLYNVQVDILSVSETAIIDIIQDDKRR
jgi:hypothetical protein